MASDQGLHCLLTECYVEKMRNTNHISLKRKCADPIGINGKIRLA